MPIRTLVLALALGAVLGACHRDRTPETAAELRQVVTAARRPAYIPAARWATLRAIYRDRDYAPLWLERGRPSERGRALVEALLDADRQGLRMADYDLAGLRHALEAAYAGGGQPDPAATAAVDLRLTRLFLDYGSDLVAGRLDPAAVDSGWYIKARRASVDSVLRVAARQARFRDMIVPLLPRDAGYGVLVDALARYREIAARGGWPAVPGSRRLVPGDRGPRVAALRARLAATGDLAGSAGDAVESDRFDAATAKAVAHFRLRHGLERSDTVDAATLAALNVPVATRIRQLELNLERLRWLPTDLGARYILVNIPDYRLHAYDGGRETLTMRVIVGKQYESTTPVFADTMSYVVFHPRWDLPADIVRREFVPKMQADVDYAQAHGYEIVDPKDDSTPVDPRSIDWKDVDTADFAYHVRQRSGDQNALGRIKFIFPNRFDVYLHDTPSRELFRRDKRDLSHGCVRVEDPEQLARFVLEGDTAWPAERIRAALAGDSTQRVHVPGRLPVYLVYLTAFAQDGELQFRDDTYGADRRAIAKLGPPAPPERVAEVRDTLRKLLQG